MDALSAKSPTPHHAAAASSSPPGETDGLYAKLWQACAGPCVNVPQSGEPVFYFPQGHLEQVAAFTQLDGYVEIPTYGLPPKIFCKVVSVRLKAEAHTDEVFAELTLIPEPKQEKVSSGGKDSRVLPSRTKAAIILSKTLTQSDTSTHGGFSIPKRLADECFPPLDMSQQPPAQELVMKDLHGDLWNFRHIYRGQPKRHLLTSGWSTFVNLKKLAAGDTCIFLRGEDGELRIGIRRAKKQHNSATTSVISGHSMQLGILATASFAVTTGTMFTVYYRPWTNPCEFIIPLDRYMKSTKRKYSLGMRIQMQFEAEESTRRYAGTIIGIDDIDGHRWPGSEWRNLKVQWDAMPDTNIYADRVSPWNIEPLESARNNIPNLPPPKRPRVPSPSLPVLCGSTKDVQHASQRSERDLQGQDYNEVGSQSNAQKRILTDAPLLSNTTLNGSQSRMKNQLHFQLQNPLCHSLGSSASFPDDDISISSLPKQPPVPTTYEACNVSVPWCFSNSKVNSIDSESQARRASESRDESEVPFGQPAGYGRNEYKLFGVRLNHSELPSQQLAASSNTSSLPPMSESSISASVTVTEPSKSVSGVTSQNKCKKCCSVNRSCTKVLKHGSALGRSVDLSCFQGYDDLISELDSMFDFKGGLINGSSGWHVIPIDFEGDYMLFDDYTWQDFQWAVQKMIICPKEDTNNLNVNASTTDSTNM